MSNHQINQQEVTPGQTMRLSGLAAHEGRIGKWIVFEGPVNGEQEVPQHNAYVAYERISYQVLDFVVPQLPRGLYSVTVRTYAGDRMLIDVFQIVNAANGSVGVSNSVTLR